MRLPPMSDISMRYGQWIDVTRGGPSRLRERVRRLRMALRRPLFEFLEERLAPAVSIQFDYTYDTSGFFSQNPQAKTVLQQAGQLLGSQLNDNLSAINPSGTDTWTANFFNPSNPSAF